MASPAPEFPVPLSQLRIPRRRFITRGPVVVAGGAALTTAAVAAGVAVAKTAGEALINAAASIGQESENGRHEYYGKPVVFDAERKALRLADKGTLTAISFKNDAELRFRHKAQVGGKSNVPLTLRADEVKAQYGYMTAGAGPNEGDEGSFPLLDKNGNQIGTADPWYTLTDIDGFAYVAPDNKPIVHGEGSYKVSGINVERTDEDIFTHRLLNRHLFIDKNIGDLHNPMTFEEFAKKMGFDVQIRFPKYHPVKASIVTGKEYLQTRSFPFLDDLQKDISGQTFVVDGKDLKRRDAKDHDYVYEYSHEVALLDPNSHKVKQLWAARIENGKWLFNAVSIDGVKYMNKVNELNSPLASGTEQAAPRPQAPASIAK